MRAVVLSSAGVSFQPQFTGRQPAAGEIPVRVLCAGICETDLQLVRGYMGFQGVLGHEFVGVAEAGEFAGRRVVGEINCSCRRCTLCENGLANHCPHRSVIGILNHDGAFADTVFVPPENLHPVPDEISTREAVFTEPLAAAFQIPAQIPLSGHERVVVLGDGRLGNLCAQVLAHCGCRVTVVGKHDRKLALISRRGIDVVKLDQMAPDRAADLVVDCTGSASGMQTALQFVRHRGTVVLKTTVAGEQALSLAPIVIDEIRVVGSRCGPFPQALAALARREVDVQSLIDDVVPLEAAVPALERAATTPVLKILLAVDANA
jgi:threonine dehydrogenase-like Zn-dependent dehydrogenase